MLRPLALVTGWLALLLGAATPARADSSFSLGVEGGVMEFDSRASLGAAGAAWGVRGGIGVLGPTRLEARYLSSGHDQSSVREGDAQLRVSLLPGGAAPYLFGGIGFRQSEIQMSSAQISSESLLMLPLGAGLDLPLTGQLFLAPEFTWHHVLSNDLPTATDTWNVSLVLRVDL